MNAGTALASRPAAGAAAGAAAGSTAGSATGTTATTAAPARQGVQLALGTVQFGLAYGVLGSGQRVADDEATRILASAARHGVHTLDTAAAYGDIEQRLAGLCQAAGASAARVVSKIPPLPADTDTDAGTLAEAVAAHVRQSAARLGNRMEALLFHRADDLLGRLGDVAWASAQRSVAALPWPVRLGVSCYSPDELLRIAARYPVALAQLPGNVFDQRLQDHHFPGIELHLRSVFLQGLLLADEAIAAARLPAAAEALADWCAACRRADLSPLSAALGVARGLPGVQRLVVGVERAAQFEAIASAFAAAPVLRWPALARSAAAVIDPRCWPGA